MICPNCQSQVYPGKNFCGRCGTRINFAANQTASPYPQYPSQQPYYQPQYYSVAPVERTSNSGVILAFMILSCIVMGFGLIPLAWCIPMTVHASDCMKRGEKMSTGFKVCVLLFENLIAGIIMLCDQKC